MKVSVKNFMIVLLVHVLVLSASVCGQDIQNLETELYIYSSGQTPESKLPVAYKVLEQDPLNESAISHIIEYEIAKAGKTNVDAYFKELKRQFPDSTKVFRIQFDNVRFVVDFSSSEYEQSQLDILFEWLSKAPDDSEALYLISEIYYDDYIGLPMSDFFHISKDRKNHTPKINNSAQEAYSCMKQLWSSDSTYHDRLYYAINQLSCLLGDRGRFLMAPTTAPCYIDNTEVIELSLNWPCDNDGHYLYRAERALDTERYIDAHLQSISEPCRADYIDGRATGYTRLTWLPSFDPVIVVTIVLYDTWAEVHLREGKGLGGYEPKGLKSKKKKMVRNKALDQLMTKFESAEIDTLSGSQYVPMTDGASYYVETWDASVEGRVYMTNVPNEEFKEIFSYVYDEVFNLKTRLKDY